MSAHPTRRYATIGDEIKVEVRVNHSANLTWVGAYFSTGETQEERRMGAPEIMLTRDSNNLYAKRPEHHGLSRPSENVRTSTYELKARVSAETPPGVYRLYSLSFRTAGGRAVVLQQELLGLDPESFVVEVFEEHPEKTLATRIRFSYDE